MKWLNQKFSSIEDYVLYVMIQFQKLDLDDDQWFIACMLHGFPNLVHDMDPIDEAIDVSFSYGRLSKKNHKSP